MKFERFEDLPVWKAAIELVLAGYELTENAAMNGPGDHRDQLRRAALSVSNNIAEGFESGSTPTLLNALYIARGSAGEVRSMLCFLERWARCADLKSQISNLKAIAESCSRQIGGWTNQLQNCDIAGQRHLNERARNTYQAKRRVDAFLKELDQTVHNTVAEWSRENQARRRKREASQGDGS
jgi:four helix bundle protein